ncbi:MULTISPECIES: hypothetical protein [unclassified Oceanobacillus]|uniref:hypothetical protein n=1 Tax=unclassified Oceanobacillus TaxID=2630292 RepID=UPI00300DEF43
MFPYFKVSDAPLTRGQEIGKKAKKQIHHNIKAYQDFLVDWQIVGAINLLLFNK